jgi:PKD domain
MRRYSLTARRLILVIASTLITSLAVAASAGAVLVNDNGTDYGVALAPNTTLPSGLQVSTSGACNDPSLAPDLSWATIGDVSPLCYHGGPVLTQNEDYVLTWDPDRRYWATTRQYVEQFLSDVASASGTFGSPFALLPQYTETVNGQLVRAQNKSVFAGGCVDYGASGGSGGYTCQFGANAPSGTGNDYPTSGNCTPTGTNVWYGDDNGPLGDEPNPASNDVCLTDAQIKAELQDMLPQMGLPGGNLPGYQPLVDVLLPAGVEVCLDQTGHVCSANGDPADSQAQFCSYHSEVSVGGTEVAYVVQPWTAQFGQGVGCDDPNAPTINFPVNVVTLAQDVGSRLVSPLSQGEMGAITDPALDAWYGNSNGFLGEKGTEINDNGCIPLASGLDNVTLNGTTYYLQREFNNAGAVETDPNALPCIGWVDLAPAFVVPGPVEPGDNVLFDGSVTASTLMIHNGSYQWNFGDGTTGIGPSVYHQYGKAGNYQVTLTVTDRGGNTSSITQTVQVLGSNGLPASGGGSPSSSPGSSGSGSGSLNVHLQLMPQSLKTVLANGIALRVSSNKAANGVATVWITRAAAKRAHIGYGRAARVRIGIGTVASITNGTVTLHLHLSRSVAKKLAHIGHVSMTIRLALVAAGNQQSAVDAAASY